MGYIVKNCPGIYKSGNKPALCVENNYRCDLVENCLIKELIKRLKQEPQQIMLGGTISWGAQPNDGYKLAQDMLKKFDKEEVG